MRCFRSRTFGMFMLALVMMACTTLSPTASPAPNTIATPAGARTSLPTATLSASRVTVQARFGTTRFESVQGSGVNGTLTARDNGNGTTLLNVQLDGAADFNPWGIYALEGCNTTVPGDYRPVLALPDIEMGRKEETVETSVYQLYPGNLVVVIYGIAANGNQRIVACANLGPPVGGLTNIVRATAAPAQDCTAATANQALPLEGTWLAFSAARNNNGDIYIARVDDLLQGANQATVKRLTTNPAADFDPTWSPDGRRIAFRSQRDGNDEIYVMKADGTCQVNLTQDQVNDWSPAWSPDGTRIAFARFFDNKSYTDVAVINVDGSGLTRLTTAHGEYPAWSPDGSRIAFASARDGNYEIYVMNADGTSQRRLTNNPAYDMAPAWSPDGMRIAYDTQRDHYPPKETGIGPEFEIHVMNADGSDDKQVTSNSQEDRFPAWTPNMRIAFTRNGALFVMNTDGSNQVQLLESGSFPAWRPLARTSP